MSPPLVSVVIPAHNAAPWIGETLDSVLRQTHGRREIIVVDDGSTDDTLRRLEPYRRQIHLLRQGGAGPGAARNAGFRAAAGEYMALLDHDDLWAPEKLEIQLSVAARHPESGLVACDGLEFDGATVLSPGLLPRVIAERLARSPDGEITAEFFLDFVRGNLITCPAQTLIPRRVVERIGPMTTVPGEPSDWEYYLRIAASFPMTFHAHSLVRWRYVPSSRSGRADRRALTWTLMGIRLLARQRRLRTVPHADLLVAELRPRLRSTARAAYYHGRQGDLAFARSCLWSLARLVPGDPVVWAYLAGLSLPASLVSRARRVMTAIGGGLRR